MWSPFRRNARQAKSARRTPRSYRPHLEMLEKRYLFSAGALDPTFGNGGVVTTEFSSSAPAQAGDETGAWDVAVQPNDGKIILAGDTGSATTGYHFVVARYNANGVLDNAFGQNGQVTLNFGSTEEHGYGVTVQPDGKILVAGPTYNSATGLDEFAVARLLPNGALDPGFSSADDNLGPGMVTVGFDGVDVSPTRLPLRAQLQGNQIVLSGMSVNGFFALARLNSDGSLDNSFGTAGDGRVLIPVGGAYGGADAVVEPTGKIVIADETGRVFRLNSDGSPDNTFSNQMLDFSAYSVILDAQGNILISGRNDEETFSQQDWVVARVGADGNVDTSFGTGGEARFSIDSTHEVATELAVQANGKIIAIGPTWANPGDVLRFAAARLTADGHLDTSFGSQGSVFLPLDDMGNVAVAPDGGILIPGTVYQPSTIYDFALVRLLGDPVANADAYIADPDSALTVSAAAGVLANDTAADHAPLTASLVNGPTNAASFTLHSDGSFTYTPAAGYVGPDSFTYQASDGIDPSNVATVALTVRNVPPTASLTGPSAAVPGEPLSFAGSFTDPGVEDTHTFNWHVTDTNGQVIGDGTAQDFGFTPTDVGTYTVTFTVTDNYGGVGTAQEVVAVNPVYDPTQANPSQNLQAAINAQLQANPSATTFTLAVANDTDALNAVNAINGLGTQATPITVALNLAPVKYSGETINANSSLTLILNGTPSPLPTTLDPAVPALIIKSGNVIVKNVTFTESGDAPTILVTGGSLTLRNDVVQGSTGFTDPAISITGGTLDLGTSNQPGGNVFNVSGAGAWIQNVSPNPVAATGNTFEVNGTPLSTPASVVVPTVSLVTSPLTNPSQYGQAVMFTATVSTTASGLGTATGSVDFVDTTSGADLGSVALSGGSAALTTSSLAAGNHVIEAVYGGDGTFLGSSTTLVQVVNKTAPTVRVSDGGTYNDQPFPATATVAGVVKGVDDSPGSTLEGVGLTLDYQQLDSNGNVITDLGSEAPVDAGSYKVTASFAGSADYTATSASATFTIAQATPTFSVTATTVITDGTPRVTLSGNLSDGSLIPTGSVTVTLDGQSQTVAIGPGGSFSATFATAALNVGAHSLGFSYGGDRNFTAASATGTLDDTYAVLALFNQTQARHPGSTLPIKIELATAAGQDVSSGAVSVTALGIAATTDTTDLVGTASSAGSLMPVQSAGGSNPGNVFRYQGGQYPFYLFNLQIPTGLTAGTYRLYISVQNDPLLHWVLFTVS